MARDSGNSQQRFNVRMEDSGKKAVKKEKKPAKPRNKPAWVKSLGQFFESEKSARIFGLAIILLSLFYCFPSLLTYSQADTILT